MDPPVNHAISANVDTTGPSNATSTAYEASRTVKSSPGTLYGLSGYNSKGSAQFVLVFDSQNPPGGAQPAKVVITVGAANNFSADWGVYGRRFTSGIFVANSSTAPLLTVGSADCFFDVQFI